VTFADIFSESEWSCQLRVDFSF